MTSYPRTSKKSAVFISLYQFCKEFPIFYQRLVFILENLLTNKFLKTINRGGSDIIEKNNVSVVPSISQNLILLSFVSSKPLSD